MYKYDMRDWWIPKNKPLNNTHSIASDHFSTMLDKVTNVGL